VQDALRDVKRRIAEATALAGQSKEPRLVAVSKLHGADLVKVCYDRPSLLRGELCPGARGQERCAAGGHPVALHRAGSSWLLI